VAVRREHGWDEGTVLLFVETDQGTVVTTREQALADVRKALADAPSLADDLLVQRRAEAARENAL
jgi:bifunctional DNA-binding transcriptional regulator/antitoxin component of YhaV-PrlF toxin-antitoxin module